MANKVFFKIEDGFTRLRSLKISSDKSEKNALVSVHIFSRQIGFM